MLQAITKKYKKKLIPEYNNEDPNITCVPDEFIYRYIGFDGLS